MIRKIATLILILVSIFSCSRGTLIENVVERYEEGNNKVVHYYEKNKDGDSIWVRETWFYKEGMKHLDGPIVDGKRNGDFKTYYKSGTLMSEGYFVDGKREGKATVYQEDGKIHYEGFYKDGKECGVWKFYDKEGNLQKEINRDLK